MFTSNRQLTLTVGVALVLILGIYGIAQGSDLPAIMAQPAPQSNSIEATASVIVQQVENPSGAVMFFDLAECPDGWTELADARGRYLVGLPDGGVRGDTVGTTLSALENRAVGQHDHIVDDPGHGHQVNDSGHNHALTDPGHDHSINDPGHDHDINLYTSGDHGAVDDANSGNEGSTKTEEEDTGISINNSGTGITLGSNTSGVSLNNNTTGATVENAGSVAGTNAPYIQLLVCRKD